VALRHALLASLLEGEASGYELAKRFDVSVANFWFATPQQLYRELERLEADRLVRGREVRQKRRPNKRVFRLTKAGREELFEFTRRPAKVSAIRDELLVKVQAVDDGDHEAVLAALHERMLQAEAKLALYDHLLEGLDDSRVGPHLTLMRGRAFEEENIRWCHEAMNAIAEHVAP
jgi:DNA-binding PadR family transcriptional regulator